MREDCQCTIDPKSVQCESAPVQVQRHSQSKKTIFHKKNRPCFMYELSNRVGYRYDYICVDIRKLVVAKNNPFRANYA